MAAETIVGEETATSEAIHAAAHPGRDRDRAADGSGSPDVAADEGGVA